MASLVTSAKQVAQSLSDAARSTPPVEAVRDELGTDLSVAYDGQEINIAAGDEILAKIPGFSDVAITASSSAQAPITA
ncbi:MAG: hypothetical protein QOH55_2179 [Microbacteriaceae bacterium]|jgi:hypothetical protein|nr:hypothetical protein [Microbacteriaceae bacterium]